MPFVLETTNGILQTLGHRIRAQRLAQGLPQHELAQMAGLSLGALRKLESSGQSSLETLVRAVQALGLTDEFEDLFVLKRHSIAQMERVETAGQRQRAPRRRKA
ncbi:MAG: helix-turn-helix transcriptional regulator [Burkholderiales bacterium]|nr:helix-turn-helix transcriptional regulator [Burkholderiales bacterium]